MSKHVLNIPKLTESEMTRFTNGARMAFAGHPMDVFLDHAFKAAKEHHDRKAAFLKKQTANEPTI